MSFKTVSAFTISHYSLVDTLSLFFEKMEEVVTFDKITFTVRKNAFLPPEEVDTESCKVIFDYLYAFGKVIELFKKNFSVSESFAEDAIARAKVFLFKDSKNQNRFGCFVYLCAKDENDVQDVAMCSHFNRVFDFCWSKTDDSEASCGIASFFNSITISDGGTLSQSTSHDPLTDGGWNELKNFVNEKKALYGIFMANFVFTSEPSKVEAKKFFPKLCKAFEDSPFQHVSETMSFVTKPSEDGVEVVVGGESGAEGDDDEGWETEEDETGGTTSSSSSPSSREEMIIQLMAERMRRDIEVQEARLEKRRTKEIEKAEKQFPPRGPIDISGDCLICMSNPKTVAVVPCGHVVCCDPCSVNLEKMALTDKTTCPICRTEASSFLRLFC